jgi:hypothetical protein
MAKKKFDPLWELVDEKIALQSEEPTVSVPCPHCHVPLDVGTVASKGEEITCGLCGRRSEVVETPQGPGLKAA